MTFFTEIEKKKPPKMLYGNTDDLKEPKQSEAKRRILKASQYLTSSHSTELWQQKHHGTAAKTDT
jgi:hypothetical protein